MQSLVSISFSYCNVFGQHHVLRVSVIVSALWSTWNIFITVILTSSFANSIVSVDSSLFLLVKFPQFIRHILLPFACLLVFEKIPGTVNSIMLLLIR